MVNSVVFVTSSQILHLFSNRAAETLENFEVRPTSDEREEDQLKQYFVRLKICLIRIIMKKSKRPNASKRVVEVDFISNMPDAILLLILSRLQSTEEVIRTSIFSKRWRCLWTSIPSLNICYSSGKKLSKSKFKEFVFRVLVKKSVDLDRFRLNCSHYYSMSTVGQWIQAAVMRNVKELDLVFCPKKETDHIEMPHCLVTCGSLEVLRLNFSGRGLRLPNFMGFPALRVFELTRVELMEDDNLVNDFLRRCPLLEDLTLLECSLAKLDHLCISCPKLKNLSIVNVGNDDMCYDIKICCPKLVYLNLTGYIAIHYFFECLDSLKEAVFIPELKLHTISLFPGIYHVESLSIDFGTFYSDYIDAACDPSLPNLKTLELSTTINEFKHDEFIQMLKYHPKLESLKLIIKEDPFPVIKYWELNEAELRRVLPYYVKRVELFEFKGEKPEVAIGLDEHASLERVFTWGKKAKYPN